MNRFSLAWLMGFLLLLNGTADSVGAPGRNSAILVFQGMCDASAGAALDTNTFVAASNDDNVLRIYRLSQPGMPVDQVDLNAFLQTGSKRHECDIEGAIRVGDLVYWIGSHGRTKDGDPAPTRHRFFATRVIDGTNGLTVRAEGIPSSRLVEDLAEDPGLSRFAIREASRRAPDRKEALNIEGLGARPDGTLLIGFRNPIPGDRALLVPLLNPEEVIRGRWARLGEPILLDLRAQGIRDLALAGESLLVIAGSRDGKGPSRLWRWAGADRASPAEVASAQLKSFNPEALLVWPERPAGPWLLLSDDGSRRIDGTACKEVKDPRQRSFRAAWVTP